MIKEDSAVRIARRCAKEFEQNRLMFINLGVGIPTLIANYLKSDQVFIQTENGMLGVGGLAEDQEVDPQLINAGRQYVKETPGASYFDSAASFGMIRGNHIDATVIGAFEVDQQGNIANWIIPNGKQLGVGGAMDLVTGAKRVIVAMRHIDKQGNPKIVKQLSLPATGFSEVDMIVTDLAVFSFENNRLVLKEIAPEANLAQIEQVTGAEFVVDDDLKEIVI